MSAVGESLAFFGTAKNYGPIGMFPNGGEAGVCIEPRVRTGLPYPRGFILAQNPGGAAGRGMDASLLWGAEVGYPLDIPSAIELDAQWYPNDELYVHPDCRNNKNVVGILDEMADPSDMTVHTMMRWAEILNHPVRRDHRERTRRAARSLADMLRGTTIEYLAKPSSAYPKHGVVGDNVAMIYTTSLAAGIGLRHDNRPDGPEGALVQGYVDTVGHSVDRARGLQRHQLSESASELLATIALTRSAATQTKIVGDHRSDMYLFEVTRGRGDQIRAEQVA